MHRPVHLRWGARQQQYLRRQLVLWLLLLLTPAQHINSTQSFSLCSKAPDHGTDTCSSGNKDCTMTQTLEVLKEQGRVGVVPIIVEDKFNTNCTHITTGCKQDGLGAQIQSQLSALAYARATGKVYVHTPLWRVGRSFPLNVAALAARNISDEQIELRLSKMAETFFSLGAGEMSLDQAAAEKAVVCAVMHCHTFIDEGGQACYDNIIPDLWRRYESTPKPAPLFRPSKLTVAVHVRRGDVDSERSDSPHSSHRRSPNQYYIDTLTAIMSSLPASWLELLDVVLVSEGEASSFAEIVKEHPNTRLMLNGDTLRTLHTLATADIMVMSHSSFSTTPAIYNSGIVIYNKWWHNPLPHWYINPWPAHEHDVSTAWMTTSEPCTALRRQLKMPAARMLLKSRLERRHVQVPHF